MAGTDTDQLIDPRSGTPISLQDLESEIRTLINTIAASRVRLCQCFGLIEQCKLYIAIGAKDFKDYLRRQRIPIPYQTAQQYATIGRVWMEESEFLRDIGFSEADGLCKLRFLRAALQRHVDRSDIAHHLLNDSFRQFRNYTKQIQTQTVPADDKNSRRCLDKDRSEWTRVWFDDDSVVVMTEDGYRREVIWFEPDAFDDEVRYQTLVEMTIALVKSLGTGRQSDLNTQ